MYYEITKKIHTCISLDWLTETLSAARTSHGGSMIPAKWSSTLIILFERLPLELLASPKPNLPLKPVYFAQTCRRDASLYRADWSYATIKWCCKNNSCHVIFSTETFLGLHLMLLCHGEYRSEKLALHNKLTIHQVLQARNERILWMLGQLPTHWVPLHAALLLELFIINEQRN